MKDKILRILSYILVAVLASALTLGIVIANMPNRYSKLEELEKLILNKFIGKRIRKPWKMLRQAL